MNDLSKPGALFLDFGGTLARRRPDPWEIFIEVCSRNGIGLTRDEIGRGRSEADRTHRSIQFQTEELMEDFWLGWFRLILGSLGVGSDELAVQIFEDFKRRSEIVIYDEVADVLRDLDRTGIPLGVVSNYNCMLEPNCRRLGIAKRFDFILASDLVGCGKPDPRIFTLASELVGVDPPNCLHVGDSYGADFKGGIEAGLEAALLDRSGSFDEPGVPTMRDLRPLVPLIRGV